MVTPIVRRIEGAEQVSRAVSSGLKRHAEAAQQQEGED
jgi:hypothetical protein